MPVNTNMEKDSNNIWYKDIEITAAGTKRIVLKTENTFVDADIRVDAHANAAGDVSFSNTTSTFSVGTRTNGSFPVTGSIAGTVAAASANDAGWLSDSANITVSQGSVNLGTLPISTLTLGSSNLTSGSTVNPLNTTQTITIGAGYEDASRTVVVGSVSAGPKGTVTSGSATISTITYSDGSNNNTFTVAGSADVSAPTVSTAGYISSDASASVGGTKNSNPGGAVVSTTVNKIIGSTTVTGTMTYTPAIGKATLPSGVVNASANESATTTTPTSSSTNAWVAIQSEANTGTLTITPTVTTAGYGTSTKHGIAGTTATVGASESAVTYVKIKSATIKTPDTVATLDGPTYQSSGTNSGKFLVQVAANSTIAAPTITAEGYVNSSNIGTKNTGTLTGSLVLNKIGIGTTLIAGGSLTNTLSKGTKGTGETWTNGAGAGNAQTATPTTGVFIKVDAAAINESITVKAQVNSDGYGTTNYYTSSNETIPVTMSAAALYVPVQTATGYSLTIANSTGISGSSDVAISSTADANNKYTVTANNLSVTGTFSASTNGWFSSASATDTDVDSSVVGLIPQATFATTGGAVTVNSGGYIPAGYAVTTLATATFGNDVASGKTQASYNDISAQNASPTLISGKGLYINAGYIGDTYISLAKLVPDDLAGSAISFAPAAAIRKGYTAWDADGAPIAGTMETYDGTYILTFIPDT